MNTPDLSRARWRTSSHSSGNGACVQVTAAPGGIIAVRDSKDPAEPRLDLSRQTWEAFTRRAETAPRALPEGADGKVWLRNLTDRPAPPGSASPDRPHGQCQLGGRSARTGGPWPLATAKTRSGCATSTSMTLSSPSAAPQATPSPRTVVAVVSVRLSTTAVCLILRLPPSIRPPGPLTRNCALNVVSRRRLQALP